MLRTMLCSSAIVLAACGGPKEEPPQDAMADTTSAVPAAPAPIALSDIAGKWTVSVMSGSADTTYFKFDMVATGDTSGWSFNFPNRKPVPVRVVAVEGDSIVTEAGPFESMLRKGVQVTSTTVNRLQDGKLVGTTTARYKTTGPDSVTTLHFEATRAQ